MPPRKRSPEVLAAGAVTADGEGWRLRRPRWEDEPEATHQAWCIALLRGLGFDDPYVTDQGVRMMPGVVPGTMRPDPRGTRTTAGIPDIAYAFHRARVLLLCFEVKPPAKARKAASVLSRAPTTKPMIKEYRRAFAQREFGQRLGVLAGHPVAGQFVAYGYGSLPELVSCLGRHFAAADVGRVLKTMAVPHDLEAFVRARLAAPAVPPD